MNNSYWLLGLSCTLTRACRYVVLCCVALCELKLYDAVPSIASRLFSLLLCINIQLSSPRRSVNTRTGLARLVARLVPSKMWKKQ